MPPLPPHTDTHHHGLFTPSSYNDTHLNLSCLFDTPLSWKPAHTLTRHTAYTTKNCDWLIFRSDPEPGEAPPVISSLTALSLPFSVSMRNDGPGGRRGPGTEMLAYKMRVSKNALSEAGITIPVRRYPFVARWYESGTLEVWLPLIPVLELIEHSEQSSEDAVAGQEGPSPPV